MKEREKTWELETEGERKRCGVFKEELDVERGLRRKMEVELRNVRHDLQRLKQNFDNVTFFIYFCTCLFYIVDNCVSGLKRG